MSHLRTITTPLALYFLAFCGCLLLTAPGCGASQRSKTMHATVVSLNAARDGFLAWDDQHQTALVASSVSHEDGMIQLAAYHVRRQVVIDALALAYQMASDAATFTGNVTLRQALDAYTAVTKVIADLKQSHAGNAAKGP